MNMYISEITVNTLTLGSLGSPKHETAHPTFEILRISEHEYLARYVDRISEDVLCLVLTR